MTTDVARRSILVKHHQRRVQTVLGVRTARQALRITLLTVTVAGTPLDMLTRYLEGLLPRVKLPHDLPDLVKTHPRLLVRVGSRIGLSVRVARQQLIHRQRGRARRLAELTRHEQYRLLHQPHHTPAITDIETHHARELEHLHRSQTVPLTTARARKLQRLIKADKTPHTLRMPLITAHQTQETQHGQHLEYIMPVRVPPNLLHIRCQTPVRPLQPIGRRVSGKQLLHRPPLALPPPALVTPQGTLLTFSGRVLVHFFQFFSSNTYSTYRN